MSDNTPNAMLADRLEQYLSPLSGSPKKRLLGDVVLALRSTDDAAAALRAPTIAADPVEQDALVAVKAEHDEYHVVYYEDCVWCRSDNVDNLRKRIADLEAPTIAADDAECGWCALEECKECPLRRKDHAGATTHDYEPRHEYFCAGCPGNDDVLWNSDNYTEHPGYDHDFDPIPFATLRPTIAAPSPSNEVTPEMVEAGTCAALAVDVGPGAPDPCCSIRDYPHPVPATCYLCKDQMEKVVRAAIEAALKARKPSPSQADDARTAPEPSEGEKPAPAFEAAVEAYNAAAPEPFGPCSRLAMFEAVNAAFAIRAALAERGANDKTNGNAD